MAARADAASSLREPAMVSPAVDHDASRGRKRSRSATRGHVKSFRTDESSTLRGRSPRRASSPFGLVSRGPSPAAISTSMLRYSQLRHARREHCPSRAVSPSEQRPFRRRQRTRSRSSGLPLDQDSHRSLDGPSGLRNEVLLRRHEQANDNDK